MDTQPTAALFVRNAVTRMAELGVTRAELSRRTGIKPPHVTALLNKGHVNGVAVPTMERIAAALSTSVGCLLEGNATKHTLPRLGWVPCGKPSDVDTVHEETDFAALFAEGTFTLEVRGDSMSGGFVMDGDVIVVKKCETANPGEMVVAVVNGERTMKLLGQIKGRPALVALNDSYPPIILGDEDDAKIEGVVIGGVWTRKQRRWKPQPKRPRKQ